MKRSISYINIWNKNNNYGSNIKTDKNLYKNNITPDSNSTIYKMGLHMYRTYNQQIYT